MKGRRRILRESREAVRKMWLDRGRLDLAILSAAAAMEHRGDSEETAALLQAEVVRIRERWNITLDDEIEAIDQLKKDARVCAD